MPVYEADVRFVAEVLARAKALAAADQARLVAIGDRQHLWKSDPAGRRQRGARQAACVRAADRALDRLVAAAFGRGRGVPASRDQAHPSVVDRVEEIWRTNGPTPHEGAKGTGTIATRNLLENLQEGLAEIEGIRRLGAQGRI